MSTCALPRRSRPAGRTRRPDESGAALVEFALVAALFFLMLYGIVVLGMALAVKQSVTAAASEAARSTVGALDRSAAEAAAKTTVANRLSWLGSNYQASDTTIAWVDPGTGACSAAYVPPNWSNASICVTVSIPYRARSIVPPAPLVDKLTPTSVRSTAVVQSVA